MGRDYLLWTGRYAGGGGRFDFFLLKVFYSFQYVFVVDIILKLFFFKFEGICLALEQVVFLL